MASKFDRDKVARPTEYLAKRLARAMATPPAEPCEDPIAALYASMGQEVPEHIKALQEKRRAKERAGGDATSPAPSNAPNGDNAQDHYTPALDLGQVKAIRPVWGGPGVTVDYRDGRRETRRDLDHDAIEAQAQAAGWVEGSTGSGFWLSPAAVVGF